TLICHRSQRRIRVSERAESWGNRLRGAAHSTRAVLCGMSQNRPKARDLASPRGTFRLSGVRGRSRPPPASLIAPYNLRGKLPRSSRAGAAIVNSSQSPRISMKALAFCRLVALFAAGTCVSFSQTLTLAPEERLPDPVVAPASDEAQLAIQRFSLPPGPQAKLWAADPLLANPVAIDFDEKGRLFVAETHRYGTS